LGFGSRILLQLWRGDDRPAEMIGSWTRGMAEDPGRYLWWHEKTDPFESLVVLAVESLVGSFAAGTSSEVVCEG
jgi:hypothetical protein